MLSSGNNNTNFSEMYPLHEKLLVINSIKIRTVLPKSTIYKMQTPHSLRK